jgi:hypothetical protein
MDFRCDGLCPILYRWNNVYWYDRTNWQRQTLGSSIGKRQFANVISSYNTNFSAIFLETIRDGQHPYRALSDFQARVQKRIDQTTAHEIGHRPHGTVDQDHAEKGIMAPLADEDDFSAASLKRFRGTLQWQP